MNVSKEPHPSPSLAPMLFLLQLIQKQKKNFDQEKSEMDVIHEEMQKMKKEMSRLESVAKDEQWKHTLVEQRLEQKMQEGMTVFNRLMSKLLPDAFASETSVQIADFSVNAH